MSKSYKILVINPGSTSTKVAVYENEKQLDEKNLEVSREELTKRGNIFDQYPQRRAAIEKYVADLGMSMSDFNVVVSRGCGGGHQKAGGYLINEAYVKQCHDYELPHPSSLGPCIAFELMHELNIPGYIYDGEGVDEFNEYAVLSGLKQFPLAPGSHTLNAKAAARKGAAMLGGKYEDFNLIVCHLGGGVSTSMHEHSRLVDSTADAYGPERAGGTTMTATIPLIRRCFSGEYTLEQMLKMQMGGGGLVSYLGTSDLREVERRIAAGDKEAEYYYDGMIYQLAKCIGGSATIVNCDVDGIVLTGGMAYSKLLTDRLARRVEKIAPVLLVPGSHEMESLALGALRIERGEEDYHLYGTER